jgi:hypothetical protein
MKPDADLVHRTLVAFGRQRRADWPPRWGVQIPERSDSTVPASMRLAYRQAAALPMKLIVTDRKAALFPVEPADYERDYLEVTQPAVIEALVASFETY